MLRSCLSAVLLSATLIFTVGCAEPPHKEMDQAQGAIDAARAAGAEQYATTAYTAATTALTNSHDAVAAGDYRLALNYALESHDHAQNAARETADSKAAMRASAERTIAELDLLLAQGDARVATAQRARAQRLAEPVNALATIREDVQEAREAVEAGDYLAAQQGLEGLRARIDEVLMAISRATTPQPARRRR